MITVGIIEDDHSLRKSMEEFISSEMKMQMLFSCNSIERWLSFFEKDPQEPFVLFLDIGLPGISGLKAISVIKKEYPTTNLIVISGDSSTESVWEAVTNGANGYLLKPFSLKEIRQHIDIIRVGGAALSPTIAEKLIKQISTGEKPNQGKTKELLTKRESEVMEQLIKGLSYKEVSQILKISTATVNDHIKNIYNKMGVNSKSELIVKVLKSRDAE
jgi:DNA-binding NarL/FixJ family response regulator